ncbi:MAG TPA: hypothetical protein VH744_05845 [Terriglobales bacterium]|jgi:hypothetical protein
MVAKRLVAGYFTLVGLPLLVVLLVLKLGEGITAPLTIDGAWVMEAQAEPVASGDCSGFFQQFAGRTLTVTQSGRFLSASWEHRPDATLRGELAGDRFTLSSGGEVQGNCEQAPLRIDGHLLETQGKHALDARLSLPSCAACGELQLVSLSHNGSATAVLPRGF